MIMLQHTEQKSVSEMQLFDDRGRKRIIRLHVSAHPLQRMILVQILLLVKIIITKRIRKILYLFRLVV
jgi:hypothetical protein